MVATKGVRVALKTQFVILFQKFYYTLMQIKWELHHSQIMDLLFLFLVMCLWGEEEKKTVIYTDNTYYYVLILLATIQGSQVANHQFRHTVTLNV